MCIIKIDEWISGLLSSRAEFSGNCLHEAWRHSQWALHSRFGSLRCSRMNHSQRCSRAMRQLCMHHCKKCASACSHRRRGSHRRSPLHVVVGVAMMVGVQGRVLASRSTWLHIGISIGADDEGIVVIEVEAIITTLAYDGIKAS